MANVFQIAANVAATAAAPVAPALTDTIVTTGKDILGAPMGAAAGLSIQFGMTSAVVGLFIIILWLALVVGFGLYAIMKDKYQAVGVAAVMIFFTSAVLFTFVWPATQVAAQKPSEYAKQKIANYYGDKRINDAFNLGDPFLTGKNAPTEIGRGKTVFIREGCWNCHTLMPENSHDWAYFGAPPTVNDFVGENPTVVGSDRKAPDLMHIGSRMPIYQWHLQHMITPRGVTEGSIMPNFDYLISKDKLDAYKAAYAKDPAGATNFRDYLKDNATEDDMKGTDMDALVQFLLSLK
jgi:cytochrome c oxidase cbb3-type subunit 2